jgi:branched-chain amino acid transport system ATP-binding protein
MSLLEIKNLYKNFGGVKALQDVNMSINEGEITALIGPNGAGKTTLFNIISGMLEPTSGNVFYNGEDITKLPTHKCCTQLGMARTFQTIQCFGDMTVKDNLLLTAQRRMTVGPLSSAFGLPKVRRQEKKAHVFVEGVAEFLKIQEYMQTPMSELPIGLARKAELARALCLDSELLLLDEPSSGMDTNETEKFSSLVRSCSKSMGITILYVEHDVDLVASISDKVWVLDYGKIIANGTSEDVYKDEKVIKAYLGT